MTDNRETIIRLAREAGMDAMVGKTHAGKYEPKMNALKSSVPVEWLERLAQLVMDDYIQNRMPVLVARARDRATAYENARCITDCQMLLVQSEGMARLGDQFDLGRVAGQQQCIAAILARSA